MLAQRFQSRRVRLARFRHAKVSHRRFRFRRERAPLFVRRVAGLVRSEGLAEMLQGRALNEGVTINHQASAVTARISVSCRADTSWIHWPIRRLRVRQELISKAKCALILVLAKQKEERYSRTTATRESPGALRHVSLVGWSITAEKALRYRDCLFITTPA